MLHSKCKLSTAIGIAALGWISNPWAAALPTTTVTYDQIGMPFVVSDNAADGYSALCYAMAKDRLFQMDLLRRSAYGELAEIFGAGPAGSVLQQDLTLRAHQISTQAGARLSFASPETQQILSACSRGVNRYINEAGTTGGLPIEFSMLGYAPDQWHAKDSVAILIYMGAGFSNIGTQTKLQRAALAGVFGPGIANDLVPPIAGSTMFDASGSYQHPAPALPAPPAAANKKALDYRVPLMKKLQTLPELIPTPTLPAGMALPRLQATNSFVVGGSRSASGKPVLANDPHLALGTPSPFYLAQLKVLGSGGFNVRGASIPGVPVFLSASNDTSSWGISIAGIDDTDLYVETLTQVGLTEYASYNGALHPVSVKLETIKIAGQAPVTLRVRTTPHGPILNDAIPALDAFGPIALKATFANPAWKIDGYFALPRTVSWTSFQSAVDNTGIGLNFLYADAAGTNGNIGYKLAGLIPQRNPENLYVPVSGADGQHEWAGFAIAAQRPSVLNPAEDFLVVANNAIVPMGYAPGGVPVTVGEFLEQPWRMERAVELIDQAGSGIDGSDLAAMQLDTYNKIGKAMAAAYVSAVQATGLPLSDPDAAASLAALQAWDGKTDAGSKGALVYEVLTTLLAQDMAQNVIGPQFFQNYAQGVFVTRRVEALRQLMANPHGPFFGIGAGDDPIAKRDEAIQSALAKTDELLRGALGNDNSAWTWGGLHTLRYNHPLADAPIPGNPFALPIYPASGDFATLNIGWWGTRAGLLANPVELAAAGGPHAVFAQDALAAVRLVWDAADPNSAWGALSTGQSGNPFSAHWADQAAQWRAGNLLPLSYEGLEQY